MAVEGIHPIGRRWAFVDALHMSYNGRATPRAEPARTCSFSGAATVQGSCRVFGTSTWAAYSSKPTFRKIWAPRSSFTSLRLKDRFVQGHLCGTQNPDRV